MKRFLLVIAVMALLVLATTACSVQQPGEEAVAISDSVEATLTAVAVSEGASAKPAGTPEPPAKLVEKTPVANPNLILPPTVPDFDPASHAITSKGDPDAPVVIYEWSDYT